VLYKAFLRYPEALRPAFPRLTEKIEDTDPSVVSAVVTVLCELCIHNPQNYLPMAPTFYRLLQVPISHLSHLSARHARPGARSPQIRQTCAAPQAPRSALLTRWGWWCGQTSTNNWMTIKLVRIFGQLAPLEPRLGKKLVEPLRQIMTTTPAKSLLYECIRTVTHGESCPCPPCSVYERRQRNLHHRVKSLPSCMETRGVWTRGRSELPQCSMWTVETQESDAACSPPAVCVRSIHPSVQTKS